MSAEEPETPEEIAAELSVHAAEVVKTLTILAPTPRNGALRRELMGWRLTTVGWGGREEYTDLGRAVREHLRKPAA